MFPLWHAIFPFPVRCRGLRYSQTNKKKLSTLLLMRQPLFSFSISAASDGSGLLSRWNEHDTLASGKRLRVALVLVSSDDSFNSVTRTAGEEAFATKPGWFQTFVSTAGRSSPIIVLLRCCPLTFCSPASGQHVLALLLRLFVLAGIKSKALIFGRAVWVISAV